MTYYMQKPAKFPEVSFSAGPNPMSKCLDFKSYINSQLYSRPPNINSSSINSSKISIISPCRGFLADHGSVKCDAQP